MLTNLDVVNGHLTGQRYVDEVLCPVILFVRRHTDIGLVW